MDKKQKVGNLTIEILDFFLGIPEAIVSGFDRKGFYRIMQGMPAEKSLTVSNICKIFHSFKKSGYIEIINANQNESIRFTNKAQLAIIDKLAERHKTDNKYCLISFDIPEKFRSNRDKFRRVIKRMGFCQIQKSLWVCDRSVGWLIELAAKEYRVSDYVVYIISERTNIDQTIPQLLAKRISR
ncbi:MAG: hypothetical protein M1324_02725 [Patescibacteria group bacterium]|nr:hypothetical protein [Patescibacteria group bacterium]